MTDPFDEMLEEMKKREGEKARSEGMRKGRLEGRLEGKREGEYTGKIQGTIKTCKKLHVNQEETLKNLIEEFTLSKDKAKEYINMYW